MKKATLTIIILTITAITLTGCTDNQSQENNLSVTTTSMSDNTTKVDLYSAAPPVLSEAELAGKQAVISTAEGEIVIEFFSEEAPATVSNFIFLTNDKFFDGLTFHRREEGFVLQGGDPAGDGTGGPGYTVSAEIAPGLSHTPGAVAMARLPDVVNPLKESSGSQFYITLGDATFLDGEYTVFGKVVAGMEVVNKLKVGAVIEKVTIR